MNTPTLAPSLPPRTELPTGTLDERIALAEQRLVAREQLLQRGGRALLQRAQTATEPRRMLRPAMYAVGALALAWGAGRLLRRERVVGRPDSAAASATTPAASSASRFGKVPWVRAATLLWPLLPVAWRGRMGPDTASILMAVGLPLAGLLFSKRQRSPSQSTGPE